RDDVGRAIPRAAPALVRDAVYRDRRRYRPRHRTPRVRCLAMGGAGPSSRSDRRVQAGDLYRAAYRVRVDLARVRTAASIAARSGIAGCAPRPRQESPAAALARRIAVSMSPPASSAAASTPTNVSPAPVVSTGSIGRAGTAMRPPPGR